MLLYIDEKSARLFHYRTQTGEYGPVRRYYCAAAPSRAILVTHNNLDLNDLHGKFVDATLGWDNGWRDFVRAENTDRRHTKITVYRIARLPAKSRKLEQLSDILHRAPRD